MKIICGWHVANSILAKSFEEKNYITSLKLNYLVYLLCSEYLYLERENLFNESFEKTEIGPIAPSIYSKFDMFFIDKEIRVYAKDATGRVMRVSSPRFDECLSYVWEKYKNLNEDTILSRIESGVGYSSREKGEILTVADMLSDEISRKEAELENAKSYIKKLTLPRNK